MRCMFLAFGLMLASCHFSRAADPNAWLELQSDHFVLQTDLGEPGARRVISQLEIVRAGMISASWHGERPLAGRVQAVALATAYEIREFAPEGISGYFATDAFGDRMLVTNGEESDDGQAVLKHELAHMISNEYLLRHPRWVSEGIACYLETLRIDKSTHRMQIGNPNPERVAFTRSSKIPNYAFVMATRNEALALGSEAGFAFETASWLQVHWLLDTRTVRFEAFLARLARAEDPQKAFTAEFPDLTEAQLERDIDAYVHYRDFLRTEGPEPHWAGEIRVRRLPRADMHALRALLLGQALSVVESTERRNKIAAELAQALEDDPGNALALHLSGKSDPGAATRLHPDDWRAWLVAAEANPGDLEVIRRAADLAPDNAGVLARLARTELRMSKKYEALEHARRAVKLEPWRSDVVMTLAWALATTGACDEAGLTARRAVDTLPDYVTASTLSEYEANAVKLPAQCNALKPSPPAGALGMSQDVALQPERRRR